MNYLQAPANAGIMELIVLAVIVLIVFFVSNQIYNYNPKTGVTVAPESDVKNVTLEGLSIKMSNSGYQLQKAGNHFLYTIYVLVIIVVSNVFFLIKLSNQTNLIDLSTVKGDSEMLLLVNSIGAIIIFIFQLIAYTSIKKSGKHLVS